MSVMRCGVLAEVLFMARLEMKGCCIGHKKTPDFVGGAWGSVLGGRYRPKLNLPTFVHTKIIEASLADARAGCRPTTNIVMT
jgi:hypothetical protein